MSINITAAIGDSKLFVIPLGITPDPTTGSLIFTAKYSYEDADEDAVFQKSSGAGISLDLSSGSDAIVRIIREDTVNLSPCNLFVEILWQDIATLLSEPIASGSLKLKGRLTRGQQTTVPVITTEDPLPFSVIDPAALIHAAASKSAPVANDEFGFADSANSFSLKKLTWANILTALTNYFNTVFAGLNTANTWSQPQTFGVTKYNAAMFVTDATTSRPLTAADHGKTIIFTSASAITVTLNNGLPSWFFCTIVQAGAGVVTISGSAVRQYMTGFTTKTSGQYSQIAAANYGVTDTYLIGGALGS